MGQDTTVQIGPGHRAHAGFTLPDTQGRAVALAGLLVRGPVVVSFYRGDWCDYCAMELAALSAIYDQVNGLGATVVASA
jgi:peroxiredoxin